MSRKKSLSYFFRAEVTWVLTGIAFFLVLLFWFFTVPLLFEQQTPNVPHIKTNSLIIIIALGSFTSAMILYLIFYFAFFQKRIFQFAAKSHDRLENEVTDLKHQNRILASILHHLPVMIFLKDAQELKFTKLNKMAETIIGIPEKDMLGKSDHDFFPKEEADFFTAMDKQVLDSHQIKDIPCEPIETRGGVRYLHTKKIGIYDIDGQTPLYLLGVSEDITENKKGEERLAKTCSEMSRIFQVAPVSFLMIDSGHQITHVNQAAMDLLEYSEEELIGKKAESLLDKADKKAFKEFLTSVASYAAVKEERLDFVLQIIKKGGGALKVRLDLRTLEIEGEPYVLLTLLSESSSSG